MNMYDLRPPKPTFFKAWLSASFIALPAALIARYFFHTPWPWTLGIAIVASLLIAYTVNQRVNDDWRAKWEMDEYRRR